MAENLVVKVAVETEEGELLAVYSTVVPDDLYTGHRADSEQDAFMARVQRCAIKAYREAAGK